MRSMGTNMGDIKNISKADNSFLYMIKGIACILVIFIHCLFPGTVGKDIQAMSRFAVLFFFVVSGRYILRNLPSGTKASIIRSRMAAKIGHVFVITLLLTLLYNAYSFVVATTSGFGIQDLISQKYNPHELFLLLMFNSGKILYDYTYDIDHLWYLYAVLYVYILIFIFAPYAKKWSGFLTFFFTGMLFFAQLLQLYYPIRPFDISIRTWYMVRNWLLEGIPFIMAGVWLDSAINDKRDTRVAELVRKLVGACSQSKNARRNRVILHAFLILGIAMSVLEYRRFGEMTVYVGSVVTICAIMFLGEAYGQTEAISIKPAYLCHLGKELSASVYYFHIMIISIISRTLYRLEGNQLYAWLKPVIAVCVSILVAELIFYIKKRVSRRK